jgi:quinol monooxygenase YgiN
MVLASAVSMTVVWSVPSKESQSMMAALQLLLRETRAQPGCEGCQLTSELGDVVLIRYIERWQSEPDMRRQVRSPRFATLAELIERGIERPLVEFALPDGVRGLEYADEVRRVGLAGW